MDLIGIDESRLPKAMPSAKRVGTLSAEAAAATGLREGTPLCVGAGDQNAAAIGAGIVKNGAVSISLGTAGSIAAYTDQPYKDPNCMTMVTNHAIEGCWQIEGYQAAAASVLRWYRDQITKMESKEAEETGQNIWSVLDDMVDAVPPGANGLVMLPYYATATTPRWNPNARGTILGLSFSHDRNCLARAFMEGITLDVNDMLESLKPAGVNASEVHIMGGPTKSRVWNQIQSDVYNCEAKTLVNADAAPLGAAILAGVGVGLFKSISEGVEKIVKIDKTFTPNAENAERYAKLYDVYCRAYEGLAESGAFDKIAEYQAEYH